MYTSALNKRYFDRLKKKWAHLGLFGWINARKVADSDGCGENFSIVRYGFGRFLMQKNTERSVPVEGYKTDGSVADGRPQLAREENEK